MKAKFRRRLTCCFAATSLGIMSIVAGNMVRASDNKPTRQTASPRRPVTLYGIQWHSSVEGALKNAAADPDENRKKPDKPIFCLRVLGKLSGHM
jgi:hypothetical protein